MQKRETKMTNGEFWRAMQETFFYSSSKDDGTSSSSASSNSFNSQRLFSSLPPSFPNSRGGSDVPACLLLKLLAQDGKTRTHWLFFLRASVSEVCPGMYGFQQTWVLCMGILGQVPKYGFQTWRICLFTYLFLLASWPALTSSRI